MNISLRRKEENDFTFIKRLYAEVKSLELNAGQWPVELRTQIIDMQFAAHELHYTNNLLNCEDSIILFENNPVGRLILGRSEKFINIADIILLPEFQRKGIGNFIIQIVIDDANKSGKTVTLNVSKNNRAINLYSRLGFKISHQTEADYKMIYTKNIS